MAKLAIISEETVRKIVTRQLAFDAESQLTSAEDVVRGSDIVITITPSESPLVRDE